MPRCAKAVGCRVRSSFSSTGTTDAARVLRRSGAIRKRTDRRHRRCRRCVDHARVRCRHGPPKRLPTMRSPPPTKAWLERLVAAKSVARQLKPRLQFIRRPEIDRVGVTLMIGTPHGLHRVEVDEYDALDRAVARRHLERCRSKRRRSTSSARTANATCAVRVSACRLMRRCASASADASGRPPTWAATDSRPTF